MPLKFATELDDSGFTSGLSKIGAGVAAFGQALSGAALVSGIKSLIDFGSNLRDSIDATDMSVKSYQRLSFAFSQSGASQEDFTRGVQTLILKMQEARDGNEKTIGSFAKLGITVADLDAGSAEVFSMIADGTRYASNQAETMAASLDILGKAGKKMQAGLKGGSEELSNLSKGLQELSESDLNALDAAGDMIHRTWTQVQVVLSKVLIGIKGLGEVALFGNAKPKALTAIDEGLKAEQAERVEAAKAQMEKIASQKIERDEWEKLSHDKYEERVKERQEDDRKEAAGKKSYHDAQMRLAIKQEEHNLDMANKMGAEAGGFLSSATSTRDQNVEKSIREGLETPAERRQRTMQDRREGREASRLREMIENPEKRIGGKKGDAERAAQGRIDRRNIDDAKNMVRIAKEDIKSLTDAIERLVSKE